ncbi:type II secretion system GspH family protein [Patescibacteria group bacterium]|nr:type II secretion system GspH family protein [Patescibacteria group bacterium]
MSRKRAFSLIEIIVTLALVGIITLCGIYLSSKYIAQQNILTERDMFISLLLVPQRMRALTNIDDTHHGIHIEKERFVLFEGESFDPTHPSNTYVTRNTPIDIQTPSDIVFEKLSGNVISGAGTTTFKTATASTSVYVNSWGRIEW